MKNNFQQIFADSIADIIHTAYNAGVLQYHPMTIVDITVTLNIFMHFNQLAFQYNGRLLSISMYDNDSADAQLASILNVLTDLIK